MILVWFCLANAFDQQAAKGEGVCETPHEPLAQGERASYCRRIATNNRIIAMAHDAVPHLANDRGAEKMFIGLKEFQCMGARPPFDHPHVYLDMGGDSQILCPYCSTLYIHDPRLPADETDPKGSIVEPPGT
jgi:uncharacterized Zn-finger protein